MVDVAIAVTPALALVGGLTKVLTLVPDLTVAIQHINELLKTVVTPILTTLIPLLQSLAGPLKLLI